MANKSANTKQVKWMKSITEWANDNIHILYGREWAGCQFQRHHVTGRSSKQDKVHIGHYFIIPVPFDLHDPNVDHEFHVGKCKRAFVNEFGTQRELFDIMYHDMIVEGYEVPDIEIYNAIMRTSA